MEGISPAGDRSFWKRCSSCKNELGFQAKYYNCSVSTCRGKRTGLVFCSVPCWDAHLGFANHRSAYAEEAAAPTKEEFIAMSNEDQTSTATAEQGAGAETGEVETLVVVSKVKKLIRNLAQLNTSECAINALTDQVVSNVRRGIENARAAGRKTVMGKDIK